MSIARDMEGCFRHTAMDDAVNIIEICKTFQHGKCHLANHIDVNWSDLLVHAIKRSLVHELHTNANVRVRQIRPIERYDVLRIAVMHDLKFAENLLPY